MKRKTLQILIAVFSVLAIIVGVRFTTQAGQGLDVVQNDGYAGAGSFLILLGGILIGWIAGSSKKKK